ncbi:SanA/YdcF family protein [Dolosicoccus paucivorans]|uniref:SanA/YdcF family protein n=1 Tax=Dolosicoccus paucivorans TaxID=84521 RepID=UPI0008820CF0|nr:ElyC/SanA/YdcF family protein [Dolosicoccus paucivorans]SDI20426.1 DUF218 domain-containing protein [Dolosicoccus paucivorans]
MKLSFIIASIGLFLIASINGFIIAKETPNITTSSTIQYTSYAKDDVPIIVLGAGVVNNDYPSQILKNRLDKAFALHQHFPQKPLIMSGDHLEDNYNEVYVMKEYLMEKGVPTEQIYLDHAGYSTYESMYRLKNIIGVSKAIVVTQRNHLYRSLLLCDHFKIDSIGVAAPSLDVFDGSLWGREILARVKEFGVVYLNYHTPSPETRYQINLNMSGEETDLKKELFPQ